jgi:hypothetical protein
MINEDHLRLWIRQLKKTDPKLRLEAGKKKDRDPFAEPEIGQPLTIDEPDELEAPVRHKPGKIHKGLGPEEGQPFYSGPTGERYGSERARTPGYTRADLERLKTQTSRGVQSHGVEPRPSSDPNSLSNIGPDPEDLAATSKRRMHPYKGSAHKIPTPSTTVSDEGAGAGWDELVAAMNSGKIKIAPLNSDIRPRYMLPGQPGYDEYPGVEWSSEDLPIKGYVQQLESPAGVSLDHRWALDKISLAHEFPEFVLQMFVKAARDYVRLLVEPMKIIKHAADDYVDHLLETGEIDEDLKEDLKSEDETLAVVTKADGFNAFLTAWLKGQGARKAPDPMVKATAAGTFTGDVSLPRFRSALAMIRRFKTFNPLDETESTVQDKLPSLLGLNTKASIPLTRIEAELIAGNFRGSTGEPGFRYYVDGQGGGKGSRQYYWDWVREQAHMRGGYRGKNALKKDTAKQKLSQRKE